MKTLIRLTLVSLILVPLVGCASQARTASSLPGDTFTGEVWTWDERENTVTLRRGAQDIRIKTTPDQMRGLVLHQTATIRGQIAPPADLPSMVTAPMAMAAVPRGAADQQTISGIVTAVDPSGRLAITTERGPLHVWAAAGANQRFAPGDRVQVVMFVQPVDMVPATGGAAVIAAPTDPSASTSSQPGDSAVVTGRVIGVDRGVLVVESPTGPIQVWVGDSPRYVISQPVQVRTKVSKAQ